MGSFIAGDVLDANDIVATNLTLAGLRTACVPLFGAARGAASESAVASQDPAFWADQVVHHVRGIQPKPQLCAASKSPGSPSDTRSQRLGQSVIRLLELGCWMQLSLSKKFC